MQKLKLLWKAVRSYFFVIGHEEVPLCNRMHKNRISYKDLAGKKVFNPQNMTVAQLKVALCKLGVEKSENRYLIESMSFKLCYRISFKV